MKSDPLAVPATPARVRRLALQASFDGYVLGRALVHASLVPDRAAWARFIDGTLLLLAVALSLSGIIFFFAYNWAEMHRFVKLGLIEVSLGVAATCAVRWGPHQLMGKIALLAATVLVGALLAVFGQSYQTGADSFQLFLGWAILIVPWVVIANWSILWLLLIVLLNTSLALFWDQWIDADPTLLLEVMALGNALWLQTWHALERRGTVLARRRWLPQIGALWLLLLLILPTMQSIWDGMNNGPALIAPVLYLALGGLLVLTSYVQRDLLVLTLAAFSVITILTTTAARLVDDGFGSYIVLSGLVIAQATAAVHLLLRVQRRWEQTV